MEHVTEAIKQAEHDLVVLYEKGDSVRETRLPGIHQMDITQILLLSDFEKTLRIVTLSFDYYIKIFEIDTDKDQFCTLQKTAIAKGQILNAI